jgi:hypothetical protein
VTADEELREHDARLAGLKDAHERATEARTALSERRSR